MSHLYELDCHCQFSASADPGANGGIDDLMSSSPANVSTIMEASSALTSPCREIETLTSNVTVLVKEQIATIPGDPPRYSVFINNLTAIPQAGDQISIPTVGSTVSALEIVSETSFFPDVVLTSRSAIVELKSGLDLVLNSVYPAELTTFRCRDILPYINRDRHVDMALEVTSDIVIHDVFLRAVLEASSASQDGLTANYSVNQDLNAIGEIESDFLDKFHGDFPEYFDLSNYTNSQKLYASGDIIPDNFHDKVVQFGDFVGKNGAVGVDTGSKCGDPIDTLLLANYIDEGVFIGKYTTHNEYSELIADDICTYI